MKAFLVFLLVAAVSAEACDYAYLPEEGPTVVDFIKGFLSGIGEEKNIKELEKCLNDVQGIMIKIKDALELIKTLDFNSIVKGVTDLVAALKDFANVLQPCSSGYQVLQKLINSIVNIDFNKLLDKLLKYGIFMIGYIKSAVDCFNAGQYECLGKNIGYILKYLLLDTVPEAVGNNGEDFLKGFLEGLGVNVDINNFRTCIKDVEHIIEAIKKAFDAIKTKNIIKIIDGVKHLVEAAKHFLDDLKPCAQNVEVIMKLIQQLQHVNFKKVAEHLLSHFPKVLEIIVQTTACFAAKNYHCIGKGFGAILKIAFL